MKFAPVVPPRSSPKEVVSTLLFDMSIILHTGRNVPIYFISLLLYVVMHEVVSEC